MVGAGGPTHGAGNQLFRHPGSFALVEDFVNRFAAEREAGATLNAWSVGCSTGEEAYSLAMLIQERFADADKELFYGITGTDISLPTLSKARRGVFGRRRVEQIDPRLRQAYFTEVDANTLQAGDTLRERVCFAYLNVLNLDQAPMDNMDLIFCQNMLIYFRRWRKRQIVTRLAAGWHLGIAGARTRRNHRLAGSASGKGAVRGYPGLPAPAIITRETS